jgi:hypothetical protein
MRYDRQLLLGEPKRSQVLALREVQQYGADSFGDPELAHAAPNINASVVIDPFAGSANTLDWMQRHLPGSRAVGFELDEAVYEASRRNLSILSLDLELLQVDHESGLRSSN